MKDEAAVKGSFGTSTERSKNEPRSIENAEARKAMEDTRRAVKMPTGLVAMIKELEGQAIQRKRRFDFNGKRAEGIAATAPAPGHGVATP